MTAMAGEPGTLEKSCLLPIFKDETTQLVVFQEDSQNDNPWF